MNIKVKKIVLSLLTLSVTCSLLGGLSVTANAASNATINLLAEKQVIRGFGGINLPAWAGDLTTTQRETAFGNGENQLGLSVLRIYVDDNKNNWFKELATAKKAIEKGAIVFATPWNPPSYMTETFNRNGDTKAKRLKYDKYAEYAQHLNDFVSYMKNNGVNLYAISVQNEPDYGKDWTWWTPQEILRFMKENAGSINCKVMSPESFSYQKNMYDPILNDPKALANMDILGAHTYGTQVKDFAYPLFKQKGAGKELWMTEVYVPNSDANSADRWPEALDVADHINNAMVEGNFQSYVWWYIRRSYGFIKEDSNVSKRGYMMAHFSKFVRPGYVRVDATKNPTSNVFVSAYKQNNKKVVIVAINKGTSPVSQSFNIQNGPVSKASSWVTTGAKNLAKSADINVVNGSFTASLPAQSVTTFVGDLNSTNTQTTIPTATAKVEAPALSAATGTYSISQTVSLSSKTSGVTIYYTTDGSTPTTSSTVYSSPITISKTTTLKAIAIKSGMTNSDLASATYKISTSSTSTQKQSAIEVTYTTANSWSGGASVNVTIKNNGTTPINGWNLAWTLPSNESVTNMWTASYVASGTTVTATDLGYNGTIAANGGIQSFGFNMNYSGTLNNPNAFKLNGIECTVK